MLSLDLRPGDGLGPFKLGATLYSVLAMVRQPHAKTLFPSVNVAYDTSSPSTSIVIVHLHPYIDLLFSGHAQRLHTIAVRRLRHGLPLSLSPKAAPQSLSMTPGTSASSSNPSRMSVGHGGSSLTLLYKRTVISSSEEILRKQGVMKSFGPTYEGPLMKYPGVSFSFVDDDAHSVGIRPPSGGGIEEYKRAEVKKIVITQKPEGSEEVDAFDEVIESAMMDGDLKSATLRAHEGIDLRFHPTSSETRRLRIGVSTAEDIRYELGEPTNVYYKEDDRISIHAAAAAAEIDSLDNSYFMNYFNFGLDCFVDGTTHLLKKIIIHSNTVGTPLFQRYNRCQWEIAAPSGSQVVRYSDSFEAINKFLSRTSEPSPPMVLDRSEDHDALSIPVFTTRLYAYDGIILEVSATDQVTSVTIY